MNELVEFADQLLLGFPEMAQSAEELAVFCRSGQPMAAFPAQALNPPAQEAAAALFKFSVMAANLVDRHIQPLGALWAELEFSLRAQAEAGSPPLWPLPPTAVAMLGQDAAVRGARVLVQFVCARSRWAKQSVVGLTSLGAEPGLLAVSMVGALRDLSDPAVACFVRHVPLLADPDTRRVLAGAVQQLGDLLAIAAQAKIILQWTSHLTFPTLPLLDTWEASLNNLLAEHLSPAGSKHRRRRRRKRPKHRGHLAVLTGFRPGHPGTSRLGAPACSGATPIFRRPGAWCAAIWPVVWITGLLLLALHPWGEPGYWRPAARPTYLRVRENIGHIRAAGEACLPPSPVGSLPWGDWNEGGDFGCGFCASQRPRAATERSPTGSPLSTPVDQLAARPRAAGLPRSGTSPPPPGGAWLGDQPCACGLPAVLSPGHNSSWA